MMTLGKIDLAYWVAKRCDKALEQRIANRRVLIRYYEWLALEVEIEKIKQHLEETSK